NTDLLDVCFNDGQTGWAVGFQGVIIATTNGGKSWRPQSSGVSGVQLSGVSFDGSNGYAVGSAGTFLRTTDGGNNWEVGSAPEDGNLTDVKALGGRIWIVGSGPFILHSDNGGDSFDYSWLPAGQLPFPSIPSLNYVTCVEFSDAADGWVGGPGGLLFHT